MIYSELLTLAYFQAMRGLDANAAPNKDDAITILEALAPTVFQDVALTAAANPNKRSLLYRTHTVTLTNGVGTLPDEVLTETKAEGSVADTDDPDVGPIMSMIWNWNDFISPLDTRLGYWIIRGDSSLHWIEPGATYSPTTGKTGDITIDIGTVPAIPATAATAVDAPSEITSDLVTALADALRGEVVRMAASKAA